MLHEPVRAGHGLAVLPRSATGPAGVPLTEPHLVHRVEPVHGAAAGAVALACAAALAGGPSVNEPPTVRDAGGVRP